MAKAWQISVLERLVGAGDAGLAFSDVTDRDEVDYLNELVHDGEAAVMEPKSSTPERRKLFFLATYLTHHQLYIAKGWAKEKEGELLITTQGRPRLKLVLKTEHDL